MNWPALDELRLTKGERIVLVNLINKELKTDGKAFSERVKCAILIDILAKLQDVKENST